MASVRNNRFLFYQELESQRRLTLEEDHPYSILALNHQLNGTESSSEFIKFREN